MTERMSLRIKGKGFRGNSKKIKLSEKTRCRGKLGSVVLFFNVTGVLA